MKDSNGFRVTPRMALLVVALLGGVAWEAAASGPWGFLTKLQSKLGGGVYIGETTADTKNKVTRSVGCTVDYDFPAIIAAPGYLVDTPNFTCTGVKVGDPCFVGVAKASPSDAGSAWENQVIFFALAKADDAVSIKEMAVGGDAGAMNPPDAGYNVRCLSNQ